LGVLSKTGLSKHWKSQSKMTPKSRCTLRALFRNSRGGVFRVSGLNRDQIKFRAGVFDVFGKIFTFALPAGEVDIFYIRTKSELRFFRKSAEHVFGFRVLLCCFTQENPSDENDDILDYL
jgi:hypothetical protein